jgi:hypothetical protein
MKRGMARRQPKSSAKRNNADPPSGLENAVAPTLFDKEQALRKAGIAVRPYPTSAPGLAVDLRDEDQRLIAAGNTWERELERLYAMHLQDQHRIAQRNFALEFDTLCGERGMLSALRLVNADVDHRYTGVYRWTPSEMVNIELLDKVAEARPDSLANVPIASSFCQYVLRDGSFLTANSGLDGRLDGHPYQGVMLAYCGVPIFDTTGDPVGTICHFDVVARDTADVHVARLHAAAAVLTNFVSRS